MHAATKRPEPVRRRVNKREGYERAWPEGGKAGYLRGRRGWTSSRRGQGLRKRYYALIIWVVKNGSCGEMLPGATLGKGRLIGKEENEVRGRKGAK